MITPQSLTSPSPPSQPSGRKSGYRTKSEPGPAQRGSGAAVSSNRRFSSGSLEADDGGIFAADSLPRLVGRRGGAGTNDTGSGGGGGGGGSGGSSRSTYLRRSDRNAGSSKSFASAASAGTAGSLGDRPSGIPRPRPPRKSRFASQNPSVHGGSSSGGGSNHNRSSFRNS